MKKPIWIPLKISELIELLKSIQEEHGDLPVYTEYDGNNFELTKKDVVIEEANVLDHVKDLPKRILIS